MLHRKQLLHSVEKDGNINEMFRQKTIAVEVVEKATTLKITFGGYGDTVLDMTKRLRRRPLKI